MEACSLEELAKLVRGALAAGNENEHHEVGGGGGVVGMGGIEDGFDEDETRVGGHGRATVAEDLKRLGIAPVVDDALEDIDIAARGNGLEHVTGDELDAGRERGGHDLARRWDDGR